MTSIVTVADYGVGNLHSVARALKKVEATAQITSDLDEIASAERLLLPGVGAFGACAASLRAAGMEEPILSFVRTGRPFLGICVGMQLLFDKSFEFGEHTGLGVIAGTVEAIPGSDPAASRKIPHIGWSALEQPTQRTTWDGTPLAGLTPNQSAAYFVHSFSGSPLDPASRLANVDYIGFSVCAAVQQDNVCGVQFHPEKSGVVGLTILDAFCFR